MARGKTNKAHLIPAEKGWVTVGKSKENSVSISSEITRPITAPVQKGQVAGKLVIQSEGKVLLIDSPVKTK